MKLTDEDRAAIERIVCPQGSHGEDRDRSYAGAGYAAGLLAGMERAANLIGDHHISIVPNFSQDADVAAELESLLNASTFREKLAAAIRAEIKGET